MKRKRDHGIVDQVLSDKLSFLKTNKCDLPKTKESGTGSFEWLLDVCLAVEKIAGEESSASEPDTTTGNDSESQGEYDHAALQAETIYQGCNHKPFIGPVKVSSLPETKCQGVVSTRDVLKGELLCSSIPLIVVPNLASVDDPSVQLFSDFSRAEMTAKLIVLAQSDPLVMKKLKRFEYVGSHSNKSDTRKMCAEIISKYTWAIDHPSTNPKGQLFHDQYTKVAGHAFTIDGYAGKFNHSCVPNATMVSYGSVQFFRANCHIPKDTEICVSYGYDALDKVHERIEKLRVHAGFVCDCPLCTYQLNRLSHKGETGPNTAPLKKPVSQGVTFEAYLNCVLRAPDYEIIVENGTCNKSATHEFVVDALRTCAIIEDGDPDASLSKLTSDLDLLELLTRFPHIKQSSLCHCHVTCHLINQCTVLSLMFLSYSLEKPKDVGISFGDLTRLEMAELADRLHLWLDSEMTVAVGDEQLYLKPDWWREKRMEYTDCF